MLGTNTQQQCRNILSKTHFETIRKLGKGSFGHVILASKFTHSVNFYAIKCISLKKYSKDQNIKRFISHQTKAMCSLNHPNIVRLQNSFSDCGYHFIIMQYCDMGNLLQNQAKMNNKVFGLGQALYILNQIMKGTQAIHNHNIIHRDLKCENIFLKKNKNGNYVCKIGDFGFAKVVQETTTTSCGTIYYMAPEVMSQQPYDKQADIWSIGVIFYYMLFGSHPFKSLNIQKQISDKCKQSYNILSYQILNMKNEKEESYLIDFFKRIFCTDPKQRITLDEMFCHPLLKIPQHEETSDSTTDDQIQQDMQWELKRAYFITNVKASLSQLQILQTHLTRAFQFYLGKVILSFFQQSYIQQFMAQQPTNKYSKQIQKYQKQLSEEMQSHYRYLEKKKQSVKSIERFDEGFNLKVQEFNNFKQGYRNTVGKVYEQIHKRVTDTQLRSQLKFKVFCCHLINRVFKTGVKEQVFPYFKSWMKKKGKQCGKNINFNDFEEWIKEDGSENLNTSVEVVNKIFMKRSP